MYPISTNTSKSLLPLGNRPLIWYQLNIVKRAGFKEVFVIISDQFQLDYEDTISEYNKQCEGGMIITLIPQESTAGTADALRIASTTQSIPACRDLLIISGDIVSDLHLAPLVVQHRVTGSTITVCLTTPLVEAVNNNYKLDIKEKDKEAQKKKEEDDLFRQYIAMETSTGRITYIRSVNNVEETLQFSKHSLQKFSNTTIFTSLQNPHLYICSSSVLNLLKKYETLNSFQNEIVPLVAALQFIPEGQEWNTKPDNTYVGSVGSTISNFPLSSPSQRSSNTIHDEVNTTESDPTSAIIASHSRPHKNMITGNIRVQGYLLQDRFLERCNTLSKYVYLNSYLLPSNADQSSYFKTLPTLTMPEHDIKAIGGNVKRSIVGRNVKLGKNTIDTSVIGESCSIAQGAKLTNVVLMGHVIIEKNVTMSNTVVGANTTIGENSKITNCFIASGIKISSDSHLANEKIQNDNEDDEDEDEDEEDEE